MQLDRRTFLAALGAAAGSAALGGCAGFGGGGGDDEGSDDRITFTLWAGDAELAAFQALARDFEAAEGIGVELQQVPFDQLLTTVDAGLQGGQAPDVFRVTYTDLGVYSSQGPSSTSGSTSRTATPTSSGPGCGARSTATARRSASRTTPTPRWSCCAATPCRQPA